MEVEELEKVKQAGEIHQEVVAYARDLIKPGMKLLDIADAIDAKIAELGGKPAFPINLSVDEVAAHATPGPHDEDVARGLLKVDIGIHVDGFVADSAFSLDIEGSDENNQLIAAAEAGLAVAIDSVGLDVTLGAVGKNVGAAITERGFTPIKNLTGHEIQQYDLHAGLNVPNYDSGQTEVFTEGVYAIEPFATTGHGRVRDGKPSGIYKIQGEGTVRDQFAREVLVFIDEQFSTLPFCSRWIFKEFGSRGLLALRQIEQAGLLHQYPQLVEVAGGKVAQAEHTVMLTADGKKIVTTRD